jgi:hypothetical protein
MTPDERLTHLAPHLATPPSTRAAGTAFPLESRARDLSAARGSQAATTSDRLVLGMCLAALDQRWRCAPEAAQEAEKRREHQRRAKTLQHLRVPSRGGHRVLSGMWGQRSGAGAWSSVGPLDCTA